MSGSKESRLERILRFARINPVMLGAAVATAGFYFLNWTSQDGVMRVFKDSSLIISTVLSTSYANSVACYLKDKKVLLNYAKHGFKKAYAKKRMRHYCLRQAFYVACIENGFREDIKEIIENTPKEKKAYAFLPHL